MSGQPPRSPDSETETMREWLLSLPGVRRVVRAVRASYRRKLATALLVVLLISGMAAGGLTVQIGDRKSVV